MAKEDIDKLRYKATLAISSLADDRRKQYLRELQSKLGEVGVDVQSGDDALAYIANTKKGLESLERNIAEVNSGELKANQAVGELVEALGVLTKNDEHIKSLLEHMISWVVGLKGNQREEQPQQLPEGKKPEHPRNFTQAAGDLNMDIQRTARIYEELQKAGLVKAPRKAGKSLMMSGIDFEILEIAADKARTMKRVGDYGQLIRYVEKTIEEKYPSELGSIRPCNKRANGWNDDTNTPRI